MSRTMIRPLPAGCSVAQCKTSVVANGMCHKHNMKQTREKRFGMPIPKRRAQDYLCKADGCVKPGWAVGLCKSHYNKDLSANPRPKRMAPRSKNLGQRCAVQGCQNYARTKLHCSTHYGRLLKGTPLNAPIKQKNIGRICSVNPCGHPAKTKGMCGGHYQRSRSGLSLTKDWRFSYKTLEKCDAVWCDERPRSLGFCDRHYQTVVFYGEVALSLVAKFLKDGCEICGSKTQETESGKVLWRIDHDHSCCPGKRTCGKCVRGVLCHQCNVGIGLLGDSPARLGQAITYLTRGRIVEQRREA